MSFIAPIQGFVPNSQLVITDTNVSSDNVSCINLSAVNASLMNLTTTIFNPTNVDCSNLTAVTAVITSATITDITADDITVTNLNIETIESTTANISTINSSTINSSHSNLSTIATFKINISDAGDPALAAVIRRDADKLFIEGRDNDATDPVARIFLQPAGEFFGGQVPCIVNASNVEIPNLSSIHLTSTNASIVNLSATDIEASGVIEAFSVEASLLTATSNLSTPFVNTNDIQTQLINSSQINASNISTKNLSAVLEISSTFIKATNRITAPVLNTTLNNVSIINASTINSQIGNFSTTNIINNNVSSVFVKRSTGGIATLDIHQDKLDLDGGFTSPLGAARGVTIRAGNNTVAAIEVEDDNSVTIRNLSSVNFETDNLTADTANATTGNISTLNVSILNASTKNSQTMNASTINCSTINSSFCNAFSMDTSIITSKIYQLEDASGGGGSDGVISESSNVLTIRTGASGGVTKFGTTTGGNFSVQIANDALNASTANISQINATDIDATTIDADTITGDIGGNLAAGSGISLSTTAGVTTISNTGSITDPLNLSKLNVSNISGNNLSMNHGTISGTIESAISKATIFEVLDSGGGSGPDGLIYETSNEMTIATGATGGVIRFGTTYGGNFSVNIEGDALNASTANISTINSNTGNISSINASVVNSDILNGNIANNLAAGTNITLSTTGGVTTINSTGGSVSDPLNLSTLNASTGNIGFINASVVNSDFLNGSIANNLAAGTNITLSTVGGVTTINSTGGGVTDPLNVSVVNFSTINGLTSNISTANASVFVTNNGYKMVGGASNNTAGGIGSAFGNSAAFGHVSKVLGTNTYAISQTSGGKTFVNCAPTQELGFYHGGSEKITITSTEVDVRQPINMSTSNTSTSNALVANISQANASNMSLINLSADLITGDISPNLVAGTDITLSTTSGVTTINSTALATSQQYYFRATSNNGGNQTINTNTVLLYNVSTYDVPANNYNTTNKNYVVPVAGTWQFFFQAYQNSSVTTGFRLGIYKNNTKQVQTGGSVGNSERCGVILECAVGDTIDVRGAAGTALVFMDVEFSWFEGYLLQPENNTITSSTALTTNSLTTNTTNVSNSNISNLTIDNNLNGQSFIRTVAIAKILGNGGNSKAVGCSVTRTNTGRYTCTISPARPDAQYVVQLTCMETSGALDDVIIHVQDGTMATSSFSYYIHEQDNGGSPGAYRDRNNFVTIFDTD